MQLVGEIVSLVAVCFDEMMDVLSIDFDSRDCLLFDSPSLIVDTAYCSYGW